MNQVEADRILNLSIELEHLPTLGTIREYFVGLMMTLWQKGENFSGKRPFGSSCWEHDLYLPLIKGGLIEGTIDEEEGWINDIPYEEEAKGRRLIAEAIEWL